MTRLPAGPPSGTPAQHDGAQHDGVLLTARQKRRAAREARRQAKDAAYDLRQARKKLKDGTTWRGHHIVDTRGLAETFPAPETPEFQPATVRLRIIHGSVLVVLLAMVVAAVVLASMVQRGDLELKIGPWKSTPTPVACPSTIQEYAPNASVTVNVYNGSSVEGRAGQVAEELTKRGFVVQTVANKSTDKAAPAVVVSGPAGYAAAFSVQQNFPNAEYVPDDRQDAAVDVILTGNYATLIPEPEVDRTAGMLACP